VADILRRSVDVANDLGFKLGLAAGLAMLLQGGLTAKEICAPSPQTQESFNNLIDQYTYAMREIDRRGKPTEHRMRFLKHAMFDYLTKLGTSPGQLELMHPHINTAFGLLPDDRK
jgi:hypothetical protein